jgi:hypothetical protein
MANSSKISFHCPFKFVKNTAAPGIHFDDSFTCEQIKDFQFRRFYTQKWLKNTTTKLQCLSTIPPDPLKICNSKGVAVKQINWAAITALNGLNVYELLFDIANIPEATYWLYQKFELLSYKAEFVAEPISSKISHPYVKAITYRHSYNDYDMVWSTDIAQTFCVECEIMEFKPKSEKTTTTSQTRDSFLLNGVPYRTFKLEVGEAKGVSPYIFDILNRIFCCDYVSIHGKEFSATADFEIRDVKGYPLQGGTLEILESKNLYSLQHNDFTALAPGIVTAYNIDTGFFGLGQIVPITEFEQI